MFTAHVAMLHIDLLQVSLSLSYSIGPLYCTLHGVVRRGGARKRDLSTSENLGSELNRKCKTCFNYFLSVFICIDLAHVNDMSSIIINDKERN
jgi:hypothetical protein